ncbi:inositol monophosphatase [uncultured Cohaesibacter sp.]|uniref:inositol monophosphatase family protein n=1 Tax=uncultured Cohaesibacter sp. TaxID=1002546 RepID=UPI00292DAE2A
MKLDQAQQSAFIELVREAAKTEIMPRFRHLSSDAIRAKTAPDDLVTDADEAAEIVISKGALDILPGAAIIGEEAVASDPSLLEQIGSSDWAVIIDPIDGTWNFANGLSTFGVILAVTYKGETVFGLLYDPVMDDWIAASQGEGAWFGAPEQERRIIRSSRPKPFSEMTGICSHFLFPESQRSRLASQMAIGFTRVSSLRCSCHEYRLLAQGKLDFIVNGMKKPWDHAAGVFVTKQAGGEAMCIDGSAYQPTDHQGSFVVAGSAETTEALRQSLLWLEEDKA